MSAKSDATADLLTKYAVHCLVGDGDRGACGTPRGHIPGTPLIERDVFVRYSAKLFESTHVLCPKCWEDWP